MRICVPEKAMSELSSKDVENYPGKGHVDTEVGNNADY